MTPDELDSDAAAGYLIDDIIDGPAGDTLETEHMPAGRALRRVSPRRRFERIQETQSLRDVMHDPPAPGESVHILGNGLYNAWTFVPVICEWLGGADRLSCSTWTVNRPNTIELFELWDAGMFKTVDFLTGLYFKQRESAVYTILLDGIRARGGRYRASKDHAKIILLSRAERDQWITVEGSANLTANPRLENYVMTNDRAVYDFHREWVEEVLTA